MKKKKLDVLIVSWCDADDVVNYGQILQGCAMMYAVRQITDGAVKYASYFPRGPRGIVQYYLKHYNPIHGHLNAYLKTKRVIKKFLIDYKVHLKQIASEKELNIFSEDSDIFICGSDQIWHPQNFDKNYFLDFGKECIKRISYAASLPKSKVEVQYAMQMDEIKIKLNKFDLISVREKKSAEFLARFIEKEVANVLDPTYLVPKEIWYSCAKEIKFPSEYIFVYIPNGMNLDMAECLENLIRKTGITDVYVLMTRGQCLIDASKRMKFLSVGEFLFAIKNASYVFTSSFHAVVFSTIFHTNFYCYDVKNEKRGEDLRLSSLLSLLQLEDRYIHNANQEIEIKDINYENMEKLLTVQKEISTRYLEKAMDIE